jgi:hypothetical protein
MSEGKNILGISKKTFLAGLIVAVLFSSTISVLASMQFAVLRGPRGEKGDQGLQGPPGTDANAKAYISASLAGDFRNQSLSLPHIHYVSGLIINFGNETAHNVTLIVTFHKAHGNFTATDSLGTILPHEILSYRHSFEVEPYPYPYLIGENNYISWKLDWT